MKIPNKCMPKQTMIALYKMMYDVDKILNKYSIKYFIDAGTLLGAIRHKGLIPWDDDLDIGILSKDYNRLITILKDVEQYGYNFSIDGDIIKVFIKNLWIRDQKNYLWGTPTLDIFIWKEKNNKIVYKSISQRKKWKNYWYYKDDMFPLKKYKFWNYEVYGPNNGRAYCDRTFPKWETTFIAETRNESNPQIKAVTKVKTIEVDEINQDTSFLSKKLKENIKRDISFFLKCFNDKVFTDEDKLKTIKILLDSFDKDNIPSNIKEIMDFEFDKYYNSDCSTDSEEDISDNESEMSEDNKLQQIEEEDDDYNYDELEGL